MASAKDLASQPLPAFVVDRMKLWDELKAEAEQKAACMSFVAVLLIPFPSFLIAPYLLHTDHHSFQPYLKFLSRLRCLTALSRMASQTKPLLST